MFRTKRPPFSLIVLALKGHGRVALVQFGNSDRQLLVFESVRQSIAAMLPCTNLDLNAAYSWIGAIFLLTERKTYKRVKSL